MRGGHGLRHLVSILKPRWTERDQRLWFLAVTERVGVRKRGKGAMGCTVMATERDADQNNPRVPIMFDRKWRV